MAENSGRERVRYGVDALRVLVELAAERGMTIDECLQGSGLNRNALSDPGGEIFAEQELTVIRNLLVRYGADCGLGLHAGLRMGLPTAGILGYAIVSSPTVRSAIQVILRYVDLGYAYFPIFLEEDEQEFRVVLDDSKAPADLRQFLLERVVGFLFTNGAALFGEILRTARLEFRGPRASFATQLEALNSIALAFDRDRNVVAGDRTLLERAMPQANALTQRLCEEQCQQLLMRRKIRSGRAEAVRGLFLQTPDQVPDIEVLARKFNTSSRNLRRQLEAENTSYRELADEVRCFLAEEFLRDGLPVEHVSDRLGFSESASFIRAFKRWTGKTPGRSRY